MPPELRDRILITGGRGQLGAALLCELARLGEVFGPGRGGMDLSDSGSIRAGVRGFRPTWIVNAGAHTAVDKAESEPELAFAINAKAPAVFADEAKKCGAALIHYSTDYVFDGLKVGSYVEIDGTNPLNVYGRSKLEGELALGMSGATHFIFRTSWVYGATGKNFLLSIVRLARERECLRIVADQHGAPTWSEELARMTAHVIAERQAVMRRVGCSVVEAVGGMGGVYHATGSGETTWCGFARYALEALREMEPGARLATVEAISTAEYPTPAQRPLNSRLDCAKLATVLGWRMPDWRESVAAVVRGLRS